MDHLLQLTQQGERSEAHNEPATASTDAELGQPSALPATPAMRGAHPRQALLQALPPPPAPAETVSSSLPTLAVGGKRSAPDAGLEAGPDSGVKRLKVSHTTDAGAGRFQQAQEQGMDLEESRERHPGTQLAGNMPAQPDSVAGGVIEYDRFKACFDEDPAFAMAMLNKWVCDGDLKSIQALLKTPGIDVNAMCLHQTPLHMAVKKGQVDIVQALLKTPGIDVNAMYLDQTPLHHVTQEDDDAVVQALLKTPVRSVVTVPPRETPLHMAKVLKKLQVIEVLLQARGYTVTAQTAQTFLEAESALHRAARQSDIATVKSLLAMPWIALAIDDAAALVAEAVYSGDPEIVMLIMAMPWLHISSQRAARLLHLAANKGHFPLFELLHARLKYDANAKDSSGWTVLMDAVRSGNLPVVQALLAGPGIDLAVRDKYDRTALKMAIEKNVPAIIDALLAAQGVNGGLDEFLARHHEFLAAAEAGNLAQVRSLLANLPWLDVNFKESDQTALKLAVGKSHLEVVQKLLAMPGIVVDRDTCVEIAHLATQKGHLPLLRRMMDRPEFDVNKGYRDPYLVIAAENGHFPLVQALLAAPGINVNAGNSGNTALYAACKNNHYQIAMLLAVTPGIDVNASKEYFGFGYFYDIVSQKWSPLKLAAVRGNLRLVRALLDAERIDVNVLDKDKLTPLMHAAHHGHLEIVRALLAMPGIDVHHCSDYVPSHVYGSGMGIKGPFSALSLAEWAGERQIVEALLAMPVSYFRFGYGDLHKSLLERSRRAPPKPEKKQIPEQTYRFLHRILHSGFDAGSPLPLFSPDQQQRPSWLEQKCMDVSIGTCPVTDVPFLLKSTMPLPAWCQAALANAIALGFTAGHYRSAPAAFWKPLQEGQAWLAGLAFGASESRQDAIELDAGIGHELEAMGLWYDFLNTVETLRKLKADPDGVHLDSLTLLGWAARDGDLPMIRYLVALGANIHLRSPNGDAPILAAARAGQWAACAELLSLGAMPYRVDRNGYPALFHIASAFANSDTASPALAKLIRYLRLKNVRFDIPVPNPDEEDRTKNPTVLVSDILVSNPEPWVLFGKDIFGVREAPLPALAEVPALPAAQPMAPMAPRADIRAMVQSADPVAAVAAWLDADPQRLRWQDPANGEGLLHLAAAAHDIGLVRLLLDRGVDRRHADHAGRTAAQLLPAEYMSSHTSAVADIAALLR